jgi:bifunctional oligoribonuclease and PAP phosphatase NrnA
MLQQQLQSAGSIVITSHINPDGDSIGSALALKITFEKHNYPAVVLVPNAVPSFLQWLPGIGDTVIAEDDPEKAAALVQGADILFFIDFNEIHRLGVCADSAEENKNAFRVRIDHHPDPSIHVDMDFADPSVSSTAELLYSFLYEMFPDDQIDHDIASALYTGIMTDTGGFSHNIRDAQTFRIAGELLNCGISHDEIHNLVYDYFSENRLRLQGFALSQKMRIMEDCHTGYIVLTKDELAAYHHQAGDTEGFVNIPLSIKGIRCSALFIEKDDHIKLSFRSKGMFAVNLFSKKYFNGGGHLNAAGGESRLTLGDAVALFEQKIREHANEI